MAAWGGISGAVVASTVVGWTFFDSAGFAWAIPRRAIGGFVACRGERAAGSRE